jgi:hypothetical protein
MVRRRYNNTQKGFTQKASTQKIIFRVVQIAAGSRTLCGQNSRPSFVASGTHAARLCGCASEVYSSSPRMPCLRSSVQSYWFQEYAAQGIHAHW